MNTHERTGMTSEPQGKLKRWKPADWSTSKSNSSKNLALLASRLPETWRCVSMRGQTRGQ